MFSVAVLKAKINYHNGTDYDIIHYETQAGQVKILDDEGNPISDLDEMLFNGKLLESVDLNTIQDTGMYQVHNCANMPEGLESDQVYLMIVKAIDLGNGNIVVHQTIYDNEDNQYHRTINGTTIGDWIEIGRKTSESIDTLNHSIGSLDLLETNEKSSLVDSINEIFNKQEDHDSRISVLEQDVVELTNELETHNHDDRYLQLAGGNLSGTLSLNNNVDVSGRNTSGQLYRIGKVDNNNNVILGDSNTATYLFAKDFNIRTHNGTSSVKIWHENNDGSGSGLDADKVDGVDGSLLARLDIENIFKEDQRINEGKSIFLKAASGSSQAGSIFFQNDAGVQMGRIKVDTSGNMNFYAKDVMGLQVQASGDTYTEHDIILNAEDRQVAVRFKLNNSDDGAGFYMNTKSKQVGFYDWKNDNWFFTTNRSTGTLEIHNAPTIQGHKLFIQYTKPSSPSEGDVWIDINS